MPSVVKRFWSVVLYLLNQSFA